MPAQTVIQVRRDSAANWSSTNPTLANGEMGYDTTNKLFKMGDGATAWNSLAVLGQQQILANSFTDVTVANTTTETSLASYSINGVLANDLYRLQAWGTALNNSGATVTVSALLKLGATTLFSTQGTNLTASANTRSWTVDCYVAVNSTSSQEAWGTLSGLGSSAATWQQGVQPYVGRTTATEDLTSAKTLDFRWSWGTAATTISVTLEGYYVTRIR